MKSSCLIAAFALLTTAASAGNRGELAVLGFSPDGRYFAFEDFGQYDAVEGSWSKIQVVDAVKDVLAHAPFVTENPNPDDKAPTASTGTTRAQNLRKAAATIRGLGIRLDEPGDAPHLAMPDPHRRSGRFEHGGAWYEIELSTREFAAPECHGGGGTTLGYALLLKGAGVRRVLHDDKRVPRGRGHKGCVVGYALQAVRLKGGNLVVFLEVQAPGFEGDDTGHLSLAAPLK